MRDHPAAALLALVALGAAIACSGDGGGAPVRQRGTDFPVTGAGVTRFPSAEDGVEQRLFTIFCWDGALAVVTSARTVQAALSCDLLPPPQVVETYQDQPVTIEVRAGSPTKLVILSDTAGSLEFSVQDVRVSEPVTSAVPTLDSSRDAVTSFPGRKDGIEQRIFTIFCWDGTLGVVTSVRTVQAAISCDQVPSPRALEAYRNQIVDIEILPGSPATLIIHSERSGTIELQVEDIRVSEPQ